MARDISIAISARDNFTQAITTMRNANQSFNKDLEGLSGKLKALNDTKITLKADTDKARRALLDAQKAYEGCGDAAHEAALKAANADYEQARRNLKLVGDEARNTEKAITSYSDAQGRAANRAEAGKKIGDVLQGIAVAGIANMAGDVLSSLANASVGSALGDQAGTLFSAGLSGAASGAAIGSMILPGIGTAIGAAAGGALGVFQGEIQNFQKQDDAFKSVVQEQVQNQLVRQQENLSAGSGIAAGREQSLISFTTMFGGDKERAQKYLDELKTMANTTPFLYDDLASMSKVLKSYGYTDEEGKLNLIDTMRAVGDTGSALGMSTSDMNLVATAIGRMNSSGKTTLEYLNPLLERGIPVMDYLSEGFGIAKDKIYDAVSKGLIPGEEAARCIKDYMKDAFGGSMKEMSQTYPGLVSTLQGMNEEMQNAMGEGYNEERKKGVQDQIDYLSGESGEQMQEANRLIGEYQASLENLREQKIRDAEKNALDEIKRAGLSGAEAGKVLAEARAQAEADYMNSDAVQDRINNEKSLISSVRQSMLDNDVYKNFGYDMGLEYSKGILAARRDMNPLDPSQYMDGLDSLTQEGGVATDPGNEARATPQALGNAYGLPYVPRDDYLARLHEGERVLTAAEARAYREGGAGVTVQMNGATIREEADVYKIAQALFAELRRAQMIS